MSIAAIDDIIIEKVITIIAYILLTKRENYDKIRLTIDYPKNARCIMAYITRELERKFLKLNDFFKVILVTGARQVGKNNAETFGKE